MAQKKLLTNGKAFKRTDDRWGGTVWYMDEKGERVPFPKKQTQKSEKSRMKTRNSSSKTEAACKAVWGQPGQSGMRAQMIIKSLNVFKNIILGLSPGGVVP